MHCLNPWRAILAWHSIASKVSFLAMATITARAGREQGALPCLLIFAIKPEHRGVRFGSTTEVFSRSSTWSWATNETFSTISLGFHDSRPHEPHYVALGGSHE